MRLLIDVDDVVEGQNAGTDSLHLVKKLRKLDLDSHEEYRHAIREIELGRA